jgi:hypothetical protein
LWVAVLVAACGAVIWHVIDWHHNGMHLEMFRRVEAGRGYIAALYNLGVMIALGSLLGLLVQKTKGLKALLSEKKPSADDESSKGASE